VVIIVKEVEKVKNMQELTKEVTDMRKELESLKEVLSGLIQVMMDHNDQFNDEDEYN
jgi:uncharacterized protein YhaN